MYVHMLYLIVLMILPKSSSHHLVSCLLPQKAKHYPRIPFISRTKGGKSFMQLKASVWKLPKSVVEIADELELWGHIQPRRLIYCLYL